jgi:peptidoglycan/xylan/chitin deacetylase (PgdA/CDA1 family)
MNQTLATLAKQSFFATGYYARRLKADRFPGVAVLCYHGVCGDGEVERRMPFANLHARVEDLDAHCRFLRETCHPISLEDWRRARNGGPPLPERPVLLTFDEAYRLLLTEAVPVLRRHGIPAVVFMWSDPIEQGRLAWYDAVARNLGEDQAERMKTLPYREWRRVSETLARPANEADPCSPLSVPEVRLLSEVPGIELGGHSASHPILALADREQQRDEIVRNKTSLEAWTGRPVRAFAYPNGQPGVDYTPETVELVEENGFDFGFTTRYGFATSSEPPLEHSRFLLLRGVSAAELGHRLSYSWRRLCVASVS